MSKVKLNLHRIDSREELEKAALAEQSLTAAELWLYNSNTQCFDTTMKNSTMKKLHFNSFNGTTKNSTIKKKNSALLGRTTSVLCTSLDIHDVGSLVMN